MLQVMRTVKYDETPGIETQSRGDGRPQRPASPRRPVSRKPIKWGAPLAPAWNDSDFHVLLYSVHFPETRDTDYFCDGKKWTL